MSKAITPFVVEKSGDYERTYDIYSRLLEDRIVFIGEEIDSDTANRVVAQLLLLDQKDSIQPIFLYINSPGGSITAGLAIYDTMNFVRPEIHTVCIGQACSMAAVLLASGSRGNRKALPNCKIMIHQPRQVSSGETHTVTDLAIDFKVIKKMKEQLSKILSEKTGKSFKQVVKDCEKDKWLEPMDALKYGIIDEIISKKPE